MPNVIPLPNVEGSGTPFIWADSTGLRETTSPPRRKRILPVQFRRTREIDIDYIMDILADGRATLAALGIDQWQSGYPYRDIVEYDVVQGASHVVVDDDDVIVGTAMLSFSGEQYYDYIDRGFWLTDSSSNDPCYGVVHRVAVAGFCKGRGVASFLMESAEHLTEDHGRTSVRIDTHPGNLPMRNLLAKRGYTECGIIYINHAEGGMPDRIAYEKIVRA